MPRYYDPSKSDPSVIFLNWIDSITNEKVKSLSSDQIEQFIQKFKKANYFDKYEKKDILITNQCSNGNIYFDYNNLSNRYFPSFINDDKLIICQNMIINSVHLHENLIREFELSKLQSQNIDNETQTCKFIKACSRSYKIYKFNYEKSKQISEQCARTLMRHRGQNNQQLPLDQWIRFIEKELKEQQCYDF